MWGGPFLLRDNGHQSHEIPDVSMKIDAKVTEFLRFWGGFLGLSLGILRILMEFLSIPYGI